MKIDTPPFEDVYVGCNPLDFGWRHMTVLEQMFNVDILEPNKNFHRVVLEPGAIRLRYRKPEEFFGKAIEEKYHKELQRRDAVVARKPNSGVRVQEAWQAEYKESCAKIADFENITLELDRYIKAELDLDDGEKVPRTFDEYAGKKRLSGPDDKPVTKKKILELAKLEVPLLKWPRLFKGLGERVDMYAATEELTLVPRILEIDAEDTGKKIEELIKDDSYIDELTSRIIDLGVQGLRDYVEGYRIVRAKIGAVPKQKKKSVVLPVNRPVKRFELYESAVRDIYVGTIKLLYCEDLIAIRKNKIAEDELRGVLKEFVYSGYATEDVSGAPPSGKAVRVVDEDRMPLLQERIAALKARYRIENQQH